MDIETQLRLEEEMVDGGVRKYLASVENAEEDGRASETGYARTLMKRSIAEISTYIAAAIEGAKEAGVGAKFFRLIQRIEPEVAAFITLQAMFDGVVMRAPVTGIGKLIGKRLDDELRFRDFREEKEGLYDSLQNLFQQRGTQSYRHKHRVLVHKMGEEGMDTIGWTAEEHLQVGTRLMDIVCTAGGLFEKIIITSGKGKTTAHIDLTPDTKEWVSKHNDFLAHMFPSTAPCVIPPRPWTSLTDGGYYSGRMASRIQLVKGSRNFLSKEVKENDFSYVMNAVNHVQNTAWEVNKEVLDIARQAWNSNLRIGMPATEPLSIPPCPLAEGEEPANLPQWRQDEFKAWKRSAAYIHSEERKRISKVIRVAHSLNIAEKYSQYPRLFFVYQCDFRGRIYAKSNGLSPQDTDVGKGLLRFAEGKPLGSTGAYWLKVHIANKYGFDKAPYDERVAWVDDRDAVLLDIARDPIGNAHQWETADCPYQFLAAVLEYAQYRVLGDSFVSKLPVSLDGSCNGLQNFSAMLRDHVGGAATNLLPADKPADIYTAVGNRLRERLSVHPSPLAAQWLTVGIPRDLVKRPVMTLPYGATITSFREHIMLMLATLQNPWDQDSRWHAVTFLASELWEAIGEVVIAAMGAMKWLQKACRVACKKNQPIRWRTPLGFMVEQVDWKLETHRVKTQLMGQITLVHTRDSDQIDTSRMCNGIAPNFVHSMDACHMMATVILAAQQGINAFAMIHDDYGTHACDTEKLHVCIREAFIWMYTHDVLADFRTSVMDQTGFVLPLLPKTGQLNLEDVRQAKYFFG